MRWCFRQGTARRLLTLAFVVGLLISIGSHSPFCGKAATLGSPEHVVVFVIDGVRSDVLEDLLDDGDAPNFARLIAEGAYTFNAWSVCPPRTLAAVPSIFTGACPEVHGVEDWRGPIQAESVIEVFAEAGFLAAVVGQDEVIAGYCEAVLYTGFAHPPSPSYATRSQRAFGFDDHWTMVATRWLELLTPGLLTLYNYGPDAAGHEYGSDSTMYRAAVVLADLRLGLLLEALERAGILDSTLLVVTTDHGFTGYGHGDCLSDTDMRVFSFWRGPGVKVGYEIPNTAQSWACGGHEYSATISHRLIDIAPTIAELAGLRSPRDSQGRAVWELMLEGGRPD